MESKIKIVDNHVHVGWFYDGYHSPQEVWNIAKRAGIDEIAVSSTTICAKKCLTKQIKRELKELIRLGGSKVHPILWIRPDMLKKQNSYALPYFLHCKIKWQGLKLHYEAHPEWSKRPDLVEKAIAIAKQINVPILIHTGLNNCNALMFEPIIKNHPQITFILAHGCPPQEAIHLTKNHCNVYIDTSSTVYEHIQLFKDMNISKHLLFGTDSPLCAHVDGLDKYVQYIIKKEKDIITIFGEKEGTKIMNRCPYNISYKNNQTFI